MKTDARRSTATILIAAFFVCGRGESAPAVTEDFDAPPIWASSSDASWGGAATFSIGPGGQAGSALQATRGDGGSSARVLVYTIDPGTEYTLSAFVRCPGSSSGYWAELAFRLGRHSASDFDANAAAWTMVKKFSSSGANGNGDTWTRHSHTFSSGSATQISVGFKLGSTGGGPTVAWDTLRIAPRAAPAAPHIVLSTLALSATVEEGGDAASQTFTVANGGGGTLRYGIASTAPWLTVDPTSGTGSGEADAIVVSYSTSGLDAGTHAAKVTVSDPDAANREVTLDVSLTVTPAGGTGFTFPGFTRAQLQDHFRYYHERSECVYEGEGQWAALETNLSHPLVRDSSRRAIGYMKAWQVEADPVYEDRARAALKHLLRDQKPDGHFTWWNTPSGTDNGFDCQYTTGEGGAALAEGYRLFGDTRYLNASAAAARWEESTEIVWNTNYILFGVWHLAKHYSLTGDRRWLDAAVDKVERGALPRQDVDGGWSEGAGAPSDVLGHNKRIWYHGIILRGLIELHRVLPADHPLRGPLRESIERGVSRALAMQKASGEIAVGSGVPNEHRNAFILEALLLAHEHLGIDTRDAVRGVMQYRLDFGQPPDQYVGFNIDIQSVGELRRRYEAIVPEPPAEPPPPPVPSGPRVENPGFEEDGGFFALARGWQTCGYGKREGSQEAGRGWVQGLADYPEGGTAGVYQIVGGFVPGETYRFTSRARATSPELVARIGVAEGATHDCRLATYSNDHHGTGWATISVDVRASGPWMTLFLQGRNTDPYRISFARVLLDDVTVERLASSLPPAIALQPAALTRVVTAGTDLPSDAITVRNSGGGTLQYRATTDAGWLTLSPASGTAGTETDTLTLHYRTSGLAPGSHTGTVSVSDPAAANGPQRLAVALTVQAPGGPAAVGEDFEAMPAWLSTFDASWGAPAAWSLAPGGQPGLALQVSRDAAGSSSRVRVYALTPNTSYTISASMRGSAAASTYWAELAFRLGRFSARDFDANAGAWTLVQKFSVGGTNGTGDAWVRYARTFNSGPSGEISVGFKLGSTGPTPTVRWDSLRIE